MTPSPSLLFAAVRTSRDRGLAAFCAALFLAFAVSAGVFVPRVEARAQSAAAAYTTAPAVPARCG